MTRPRSELIPEGNLRDAAHVLPFRWRCSRCDQRFTIQQMPSGTDDPQYAVGLSLVLKDFAEHCKQWHAANLSAAAAVA